LLGPEEVPKSPRMPDFIATWLVYLVVGLFILFVMPTVAAIVAPPRRRLRFFVITIFFLGPFGIGFAAIAPRGVPKLSDAWEFQCDRCGAFQNVPHSTKTADCWRCDDNLF
jgi:hypothetical protein